MAKKYLKLRGRIAECGLSHGDVARALNLSDSALSARLAARQPWQLDSVYLICRELNIPFEEIYMFFPPGGVAQSGSAHLKAV